ncbi:germination protein YpeB [Tuberibacillus sp. Marseille-P3662]|uniref:germination protein YpeB n=1 Tax=Tuberibacillus sp. Marseille-P3662 TaxID=1965358 RepID=UPI000A1C8870|nr:germination protein YpeB [Tuberibacillus sp. Marseille-P3662]
MVKNIIIGILVVGLAGSGYWGYQQHQQKENIKNMTESNYQGAYHELTYYVDKIHDRIGSTLAMNSRQSVDPALADVWRLTAMAHSNVGQLPSTITSFNDTEEFLSNIGQFSYQNAIKDQGKTTLSDKEYQTLEKLYSQSDQVEKSLRKVQSDVVNNNLKWMQAGKTNDQQQDNQLVSDIQSVDQKVAKFENDWGPEMDRASFDDAGALNKLDGEEMSKDEAVKKAKKYLKVTDVSNVAVQRSGKGSDYKAYYINMDAAGKGTSFDVTMTQKGGHIVSFMKNRDIKNANLSLYQASQKAKAYLKQFGYENMQLVKSDQYNNHGVLTFVKSKKDKRLYPASIRLKVALDNGHVLAFDATDYLANKDLNVKDKSFKLSKKKALKQLNGKVKVQETHHAIFQNESGDFVPCYEFLVTKKQDTYRIFINANNGQEEKVELLKK